MIFLPVIFFALAALGGLTIAGMIYKKKEIPMYLAIGHGLAAATGLVLLVINVAASMSNTLMVVSLALFLITAVGGFDLFSFQLRKKPLPVLIIAAHGTGAVISFIVLLAAVI